MKKILLLLVSILSCMGISAQETGEITSVADLLTQKFYMTTKNGIVMAECGKTGIDMTTTSPAIATNDASSFCQFTIEEVTYNEVTYYKLHAQKQNGEYAWGWWGNAANRPNNNCINPSQWWGSFEVAMGAKEGYEENGKLYGGAYELGALFTISYEEGQGFAFKSNATISGVNKYIDGNCKQSDNPYYWNCYSLDAAKFQGLTTPQDYIELSIDDLQAVGAATVDGEVINMTNGGGAKWEFSTPQNWSGYKYLVVVPKRRFVTNKQTGHEGEETDVRISINDIETRWIGNWNPKRACVIDLAGTYGGTDFTTISNAINKVEILMGNGVKGEWSISAAYLTNTKPTAGEALYDHDADLGDAETNADHVRNLTTQNYLGVVCLPYASAICGADAYEFVGVDSKTAPSAIYVKPITGLLEAGKPYVFKTNTSLNVTFYKAGAGTVSESGSENGLVGVLTETDKTGDYYAVVNGKFKKAGEFTATIKANRAYLDIANATEIGASEARELINLYEEFDVTAIESILKSKSNNNDVMYDLTGRRIQNAQRGIYIKNGKKYVK